MKLITTQSAIDPCCHRKYLKTCFSKHPDALPVARLVHSRVLLTQHLVKPLHLLNVPCIIALCKKYLVLIIGCLGYAALKILLLVGLQIAVHVVVLKQCIKHLKVLVMTLDHHLYVHALATPSKSVLIQRQR